MRIIKYETGYKYYGMFHYLESGLLITKKKHDNSQFFYTDYVK